MFRKVSRFISRKEEEILVLLSISSFIGLLIGLALQSIIVLVFTGAVLILGVTLISVAESIIVDKSKYDKIEI